MNKLAYGFILKYHVPPKEIKDGRIKLQSIKGEKFLGTHKLPRLDKELKEICEARDIVAMQEYIKKHSE